MQMGIEHPGRFKVLLQTPMRARQTPLDTGSFSCSLPQPYSPCSMYRELGVLTSLPWGEQHKGPRTRKMSPCDSERGREKTAQQVSSLEGLTQPRTPTPCMTWDGTSQTSENRQELKGDRTGSSQMVSSEEGDDLSPKQERQCWERAGHEQGIACLGWSPRAVSPNSNGEAGKGQAGRMEEPGCSTACLSY